MEKVIVISIKLANDLLILGAQEKVLGKLTPIGYSDKRVISQNDINNNCLELFNLLNNSNGGFKDSRKILDDAKNFGQLLFDQLYTPKFKTLLSSANYKDLILIIDGNLVQIPWELLHNGENFLCQKFNMGRIVETEQTFKFYNVRKPGETYNVLILADPQGNLNASSKEGDILFNKFKRFQDVEKLQQRFNIKLKNNSISAGYIKKNIRKFDIIHYAGHGEFDRWKMADRDFLISDIKEMISGAHLPYLIFSNACKSGKTKPWRVNLNSKKEEIHDLANAFLLAGVQNYIGTFWNIPDDKGLLFADEFYQNLLNGLTIGQALRKVRHDFIQKYKGGNIISLAYILYGDPTSVYFDRANAQKDNNKKDNSIENAQVISSGDIVPSNGIGKKRSEADKPINQTKFSISKFIHNLKASLSVLLSIFIILILLYVLWNGKIINITSPPSPPPKTDPIGLDSDPNTIDKLIADIEKAYKNIEQADDLKEDWTSSPKTIVVFDYLSMEYKDLKEIFALRRKNLELALEITGEIFEKIKNQQRFLCLVDRNHLDTILREHKLSISNLTDNKKTLSRIGKVLGVDLIMFCEIIPNKKSPKINIDIIETNTTLNIVNFIEPLDDGKKYNPVASRFKSILEKLFFHSSDEIEINEVVISRIVTRVIKDIKDYYPLRGRIISVNDPNQIAINLGSKSGIQPGIIMTVLGSIEPTEFKDNKYKYEYKGRIKIVDVKPNFALARIIKTKIHLDINDKIIAE